MAEGGVGVSLGVWCPCPPVVSRELETKQWASLVVKPDEEPLKFWREQRVSITSQISQKVLFYPVFKRIFGKTFCQNGEYLGWKAKSFSLSITIWGGASESGDGSNFRWTVYWIFSPRFHSLLIVSFWNKKFICFQFIHNFILSYSIAKEFNFIGCFFFVTQRSVSF